MQELVCKIGTWETIERSWNAGGAHRQEFIGASMGRDAYKFQTGDDWLKNLSLVLKNRTSKNIVYVKVIISFPETRTVGVLAQDYIDFGQIPDGAASLFFGGKVLPGSNKPIFIAPGHKMRVFGAAADSGSREGIERYRPFSSISLSYIRFEVYFENGMRWFQENYTVPDPTQVGKFILMDRSYFPGPVHGRLVP